MKYIVRFMVFYILSIGCLLGIVIYSYQNKIDCHNEQVEIEYPGVWKLSDEYDNRNSSYMEFLHQKNSLSILKNVAAVFFLWRIILNMEDCSTVFAGSSS